MAAITILVILMLSTMTSSLIVFKAKSRDERYDLFYEAETMLMEDMPIIPIYTYTSKHLIHPSVEGIYANLMDSLNLRYVKLHPEKRLNKESK